MAPSFKEKILSLREKGFSYRKIADELKCSKATISYHCQRNSLNDIGLKRLPLINDEIINVRVYYKTHTQLETSKHFNISVTTVKRYVDKKRVLLTNEEKRKRNYAHIKTFRQRMKEKSVEYKGGKCIICGYDKSVYSLVFHHRNPKEKDFTIGSYTNIGWDKVKKELDKCDLLCNNCHGELHEKIDKENMGK